MRVWCRVWRGAAADTLYGGIAGFSISIVIGFLIREESKLRFFGGILLILLGIWYYFTAAATACERWRRGGTHSDFVTTFLLNLTNPTTVLSFLAVLAVLGLSGSRSARHTLVMIGGMFVGSMVWWLILIGMINYFRDKFDDRSMLWMNRIGGMAIGAFGAVMLVLGLTGKK